ncbi:MAG: histidine--tRNA ligase [Anaerolineaceae bacterium]|nr:histidine--tRNA ligase [Anaerolineaceae bacterium]
MTQIISSVKGTRDFYPEDMAIRNWIYGKMREVSQLFGYVEYDGPFLERIDLYAAKSGEELVKEQAFVFPDRGGDLITLRPELTPSLARMIAQKQKQLVFPQRWWSFGPFWRYERPQKGRTREFFQWNVDMLGSDAPESDAELIAICATFFKKAGLSPDQVKIFLNSRELMDLVLKKLGIQPDLKMAVFRLIDRKDKLSFQQWQEFALSLGLTQNQFEGLKVTLNDKNLWKESEDLALIMAILERMDLGDYVTFDPQIIRGLDYYTGVVFEARDMDKEGRAILGGGHYGNLVGDVGGELLPGVGFAMGDVMLRLVLEKYHCIPEFVNTSAKVLVTVFEETLYPDSLEIANILRNAEIPTILVNENQKLQKQFKYADRIGVPIVLILGPEEKNNKQVTVKNLKTRHQENVLIENLVTHIKDQLAYELAV